MKKKIVMAVVVAMTLSLAGCGSKTVTDNSTTITEETTSIETESKMDETKAVEKMPIEEEITLGKVTSIDGDILTVALGEMSLTENGDDKSEAKAPSGDKPQGEAPSGDKPLGEAPDGDRPEGGAPGADKPQGEAPSGDKPKGESPIDKGTSFKENGETINITMDDTVLIKVQNSTNSTEGTIDDIAEGSIISIIYGEDGKVTSIEVMNQGGDPAPAEAETSTEEITAE